MESSAEMSADVRSSRGPESVPAAPVPMSAGSKDAKKLADTCDDAEPDEEAAMSSSARAAEPSEASCERSRRAACSGV